MHSWTSLSPGLAQTRRPLLVTKLGNKGEKDYTVKRFCKWQWGASSFGPLNFPTQCSCYFLFLLQELMVSPSWHAPSGSETPLATCETLLGQPYSWSFFPSITSLFTGSISYLMLHRILTRTQAWPLIGRIQRLGLYWTSILQGPLPRHGRWA